jgi:two-component system chemotaxis sensor kinase CheA
MDELLSEFLVECGEGLATLDERIVAFESSPGDSENLKVILRVFHSLKGACGIFSFARMERLSHVTEDVLVAMRDGRLPVGSATLAPVLSAVDRLKGLLASIEQLKSEPLDQEGQDQAILVSLRDVLEIADLSASAKDCAMPPPAPSDAGAARTTPPSPSATLSVMDQSLRVNVDILDRLMNLVGELVLSRNQLLQLISCAEGSPFISPVQQLNRVTSGLQEAVMRTRMQPIGNAWSKLPRIVRDLQGVVGKEIELQMLGAETEIDRQILQAIQDPLTHCVRNSADHGLEAPEARLAAGKPLRGTITLRAFQEGGQINIDISDDGAGMDLDAISRKAVERGLLTTDEVMRLSESEILNLVFEPGFSTAKKVTEVSGRGVGLDVVRTNIEKVGGTVELQSRPGAGTTVKIRIPLTLAIVPALIVGTRIQDRLEVFAIPQLAVVELVRMTREGRDRVEDLQGTRVLRLRDRLLPLVELSDVLGGEDRPTRSDSTVAGGFIIVVQVGENRVGMRVDEIFDTQEIVVKPVGRMVRDIALYAGSTILGDGRVIMILDVSGAADVAGVMASSKEGENARGLLASARDSAPESELKRNQHGQHATLLIFASDSQDSLQSAPIAVPLARVARLEEVEPSAIEQVENGYVLQYRGSLLPVMRPDGGEVSKLRRKSDGKVGVIVFQAEKGSPERSMGLLVSEIIDIVDAPAESIQVSGRSRKSGITGSAILRERATEIIDVAYFLDLASSDDPGSRVGLGSEIGRAAG